MIRPRTLTLAAGLLTVLVTIGCQHHKSACCCPCSCATQATVPVAKPAATDPAAPMAVPAEPAVHSAAIGGLTSAD